MVGMNKDSEIWKLFNEDPNSRPDCNICNEAKYPVGQRTGHGAVVYKVGNRKNGWFATLSQRTGGNPKRDFTIQLMPILHLTHFSQIASYSKLAENFGMAFSKICRAMSIALMQEEGLMASTEEKSMSMPLATYGKSTTWKEKKEHLHIKIFPFRGNIGQPYTVDSSFEKQEKHKDTYGNEFVKMNPVKKAMIEKKRFRQLAKILIELLKK